ncbi:MAG: YkgJ family cysteine cluster protein, partial [Flavobacteriaceae bacterium]|nr:YkgJ family cysteine cluster protein [Flavobacteriaceae bacterium]
MTTKELTELPAQAANKKKENKRFFGQLKKNPPKGLDGLMSDLHDAEFQRTDCLDCANCCKTTGPLFTHT